MNRIPGRCLGFDWELERIPSSDGADGPTGGSPSPRGAIAEAIAQTEGEVEARRRRIEGIERTLEECRLLLEAKQGHLERLMAIQAGNESNLNVTTV